MGKLTDTGIIKRQLEELRGDTTRIFIIVEAMKKKMEAKKTYNSAVDKELRKLRTENIYLLNRLAKHGIPVKDKT